MDVWEPIIQTQVLGQYADAWEMMKEMPEFTEKLNSGDPFFIDFYEMNEAGKYNEAFDKMMKWKIEKFGVDMVKQMGYDVSGYVHLIENPYHHPKPATYESNGQKWKEFYESMSPTATGDQLKDFWQKHAEMKQQLGTNDSYHKEKHDDKHANKDWEKWIPVQKLQQAGDFEGAWNLMKTMPEITEKANDPHMAQFIQLNEAGEFETAFHGMMKWKIEKYGVDAVKSWGYDVSSYSDDDKNQEDWSKWEPITKLQQAGEYQAAWEMLKAMPDFEAMKEKPGMDYFIKMNEDGQYEDAYHMMMKWKIEKFGADMVESWGFDVSKYVNDHDDHKMTDWSAWIPVQRLQQAGDYKGAWELLKNMPEFEALKKEPGMGYFIKLNEDGQYEEAYHLMMKWNINKFGPDMVESWGFDITNYVDDNDHKKTDWSKWEPIKKLQNEGDYKGAWEMMKSMPEFEAMKNKPGMDIFIKMNENGQYEEAYHAMMQWKVDKFGADMVESWGYDVSKYVEDHDHPHPHGPPHGRPHGHGPPHRRPHGYGPPGHHGKPHWMEKKEMFVESGMAELVKPIMNQEVMEDIVEAVENMGGMQKLLGKLHMYSDPEFVQLKKNMKIKKNEAFTISTLHSSISLMDSIMKDKSARSVVDRLAHLDKQLPEATTCTSYTGMLSCAMEGHLAATPYTDEAFWPADMMDAYLKMGMLSPQGPGTQSVLSMPNLSEFMSTEEKQVSVMATSMGSVRLALTSGTSCIAPWVDDFDYEELDLDYTDAYQFHADNKARPLTADEQKLLTVKSKHGEHTPVARLLVRTCQAAGKTVEELRNTTNPEEIKSLKLKLGGQTKCALIFNDPLPLWPSCNPLDNGQLYERLWIEKSKIQVNSKS